MTTSKDIINLDAGPSRRHENFRREGHLVAIGVRERETVSVSLTSMVTRCPSRRKFSCRLLGTASRFIISLLPVCSIKSCCLDRCYNDNNQLGYFTISSRPQNIDYRLLSGLLGMQNPENAWLSL